MKKSFFEKHLINILLLIIIVIMLLILKTVKFNKQEIGNLNYQINNIESTLYGLDDNISSSVSSSLIEIEETINKETFPITEFSYNLGKVKDGSVPISLKATPKTYKETLDAKFIVEGDDGKCTKIEAIYDGVAFTANKSIPLYESCKLLLQLEDNGTITTTKLEEIYLLEEVQLQLEVKFDRNTVSLDSDGKFDISTYILVFNSDIRENKASIVACDIVTTINNTEVSREKLPTSGEGIYTLDFTKSLNVKDGDTVIYTVEVKDSNGFLYKYPAESFDILKTKQGYDLNRSEETETYEFVAEYVG